GARQRRREEGQIVEETTRHAVPVTTLRLPYPEHRKREIQRLAGQRRKKFRVYLSLAADHALCGRHAEKVVRDSLVAAASETGLYVPVQSLGQIDQIDQVKLDKGTLDVLAHALNLPKLDGHIPVVFEVKNVH